MGRDSILDDADRNRQNNQESEQSDSANESETDTASENDGSSDRERVTQRIPAGLVADIDAVQEQYSLPSRNATINFILNQGTDQLLDRGEQP
jgi:hypothetical protein